jgi:hypothetical protein
MLTCHFLVWGYCTISIRFQKEKCGSFISFARKIKQRTLRLRGDESALGQGHIRAPQLGMRLLIFFCVFF